MSNKKSNQKAKFLKFYQQFLCWRFCISKFVKIYGRFLVDIVRRCFLFKISQNLREIFVALLYFKICQNLREIFVVLLISEIIIFFSSFSQIIVILTIVILTIVILTIVILTIIDPNIINSFSIIPPFYLTTPIYCAILVI